MKKSKKIDWTYARSLSPENCAEYFKMFLFDLSSGSRNKTFRIVREGEKFLIDITDYNIFQIAYENTKNH